MYRNNSFVVGKNFLILFGTVIVQKDGNPRNFSSVSDIPAVKE